MDPEQALQNAGPDLDPNCLTLIVFLKEFFGKTDGKKACKLPGRQRDKMFSLIWIQTV